MNTQQCGILHQGMQFKFYPGTGLGGNEFGYPAELLMRKP